MAGKRLPALPPVRNDPRAWRPALLGAATPLLTPVPLALALALAQAEPLD